MRAVKFDSWMTAKKAGLLQGAEISSNEWVANADKFRLPKMLGLQVCQSGQLCPLWGQWGAPGRWAVQSWACCSGLLVASCANSTNSFALLFLPQGQAQACLSGLQGAAGRLK